MTDSLLAATGNGRWPDWAPAWADETTNIVIIAIVAWLVQRLIRRFIKRVVVGLQGDIAQRRLSNIRRRTPRALLNTGKHATVRRAQRAETIGSLLRSISAVIITVIAAFAIIKQFDAAASAVRPLITSATVLTAVIGFGAQNIVRDFLAGVFIVVEDQYGVGDVIDVGRASGTVEFVSLRITSMRDADGRLWHVPNGEIKSVGNLSQQWSRALLEFRLDLDTDIPTAIRLMKRTADEMWQDTAYSGIIIEEPEIWGPEKVDAGGILIKVAVKTRPLEQWQVSRTLRSRLKRAFDEAEIKIATAEPPAETTSK